MSWKFITLNRERFRLRTFCESCGRSMGTETEENGVSCNAAASVKENGDHEPSDESGGVRYVAIVEGDAGDKVSVDDLASLLDVGIEGEIPLPSSLDGGILQKPGSGLEKLKEAEVENGGAIDTHELLGNGKEGLSSGDIVAISTEMVGIRAVEAQDFIDMEGIVPESFSADVVEGLELSLPEIDAGEQVEVSGVEPKEAEKKQLSKNALKQIAKQQRNKEIKMQKKAIEKEKRHEATAKRRREWEEKLATLTEDEKEKAKLEKLSARQERKDEDKSRKEKLRRALEMGQNVVIDLEFSELMKPNELSSLIQQVMYSYAANGKAAVPGRISLTGVRGDVQKELEKISGFNNWLVHKEDKSYMEVFKERQSDLVYLTADSENILESLDMTKIYIIGGLVDRNRWKNITLEKATEQRIATAKLPVGDHLKMMASQVLTVNQVVELLLCFLEVGDWKKSLMQVVPLRKRAAEEVLKGSGE